MIGREESGGLVTRVEVTCNENQEEKNQVIRESLMERLRGGEIMGVIGARDFYIQYRLT